MKKVLILLLGLTACNTRTQELYAIEACKEKICVTAGISDSKEEAERIAKSLCSSLSVSAKLYIQKFTNRFITSNFIPEHPRSYVCSARR